MSLKALFFLGFFLATYLLISSHVAARELAEASNTEGTENDNVDKVTNEVGVDQYGGYPGGGYGGYPGRGGYGGYPGGGYGGYPGRGGYGGYPGRGGYGGGRGGGRCRYGCCGRGYYGGCRCCYYAGQVPDADRQTEPRN